MVPNLSAARHLGEPPESARLAHSLAAWRRSLNWPSDRAAGTGLDAPEPSSSRVCLPPGSGVGEMQLVYTEMFFAHQSCWLQVLVTVNFPVYPGGSVCSETGWSV